MKNIINSIAVFVFVLAVASSASTVFAAQSVVNSCTSITLNGTVYPNGSATESWFEWGTTSSLDNYNRTPSQTFTSTADYTYTLSGLTPNTTYYYRAAGSSAAGSGSGDTRSLTTPSCATSVPTPTTTTSQSLPTVTTQQATNVATDFATINGYVNPNGTTDTVYWFEWGVGGTLSQTARYNQGYGASSTNVNLSGLAQNTTYYYRIAAQNAQGTVYGSMLSFTTNYNYNYANYTNYNYTNTVVPNTNTNVSAPSATTLLVTEITDGTARLNGLVFTSSWYASNAWFEWGTTSSLGNKTQTTSIAAMPSLKHSDTIANLVPGQTYYYRVVAENPYGRAYGTIMSFTAEGTTAAPDTTVVITQPMVKRVVTASKPVTVVATAVKKADTTTEVPSNSLAASVFGTDFVPTTLFGWILLLILVLIMILLANHLYGRFSGEKH